MNKSFYGLLLFIFLIVPPVANLMESVMIIHMHMQMPMLVIAGFLMARYFQDRFPQFFSKWNNNGVPGIFLFSIIIGYWMLPRAMDEALSNEAIEIFKFISLPFLAGISLRDSWKKLGSLGKNTVFVISTLSFIAMGWLYINAPLQLCNNYLLIEQITLGWGFLTTAACIVIYLLYNFFIDPSEYE
ncbi:hypothetical protein F7731_06890 [Cytobacillus depressus]|uniref:Uncharacterized protein n=1 Tax=Cytobacillus depressus TaxID=1602942 RepID=A0A6L3V7C3_9BACI|nr:hypothetical protein [Cytobacillus depressus]KAB2337332.1 hypothetical protein F7731_06890 [Cytobacillus depressus]